MNLIRRFFFFLGYEKFSFVNAETNLRTSGKTGLGPPKNKNLGCIWNMEYEGRPMNDNGNRKRKRKIGLTE